MTGGHRRRPHHKSMRAAGGVRQFASQDCGLPVTARPAAPRLRAAGPEDSEAHLRARRAVELRRQLATVLYSIDAILPLLTPEVTQAVDGARQWLDEITPANPLDPADTYIRALEHTVRITREFLARHTVAATYLHLDSERPPWADHQRLEIASAPYCRHVAVRQHDVATSGWTLEQRPGFARLRGDIEDGRVQLLVVRSAADLSPPGTSLADQNQAAETLTVWLTRRRARLLVVDQVARPPGTP